MPVNREAQLTPDFATWVLGIGLNFRIIAHPKRFGKRFVQADNINGAFRSACVSHYPWQNGYT